MDPLWVRVTLGVLLLFTLSLVQVEGIKCWTCNSEDQQGCADPFKIDNFLPTDCDMIEHYLNKTASICRKMTQKVKGTVRVIRSCGYIKDEKQRICYRRAGTFDVQVEYCECTGKEGCNTATTMMSNKLLLLALAVGLTESTKRWL